ncbi:MAG: DUF4405 domain-containing protein [Calditrichaceae bacterium]|nr:DUF4405 domain-containing protein [Calditrichaceae bacterium]
MKKFNWRAFTSLYILFSFLIIILSGIILYIAPPGRIAHWTDVPLLGLEKNQWQAIHTIFTFIFIIASGFHLYFNWRMFLAYLRDKLSRKYLRRKEFFGSVILTIFIFLIILFEWPPVPAIMAFGQAMTDSWEKKYDNPPVPHMEEMTIQKLSELLNQDSGAIIQKLQTKGINVSDNDEQLKNIAKKQGYSPQQLFDMMKETNRIKSSLIQNTTGKGWGRKTVSQICREKDIPVAMAINNLKIYGITADANSRIKVLSREYTIESSEIVGIIINKQLIK